MAGTRICDPPGVAVLAWAHGYAVAKGSDLLLVTPPSTAVLGVFALAGIDRLIPGFRDPERGTQARPCCRSPAPAPACHAIRRAWLTRCLTFRLAPRSDDQP